MKNIYCPYRTNLFFLCLLFLFTFLFLPSIFADSYWDDELFFTDQDGITIVGTDQKNQYMAIIEKDVIERRGSADIADLLNETLGLNIVRRGAYGNDTDINIRGLDSKRIAFLIDGIPVSSPIDGSFNINQLDLSSVERIEVIHGGTDTKYNVSGAIGGVINIITIKKQQPGLRAGGSFSNLSFFPGSGTDTQNYSVFGGYGADNFSLTINLFANVAQNNFQYTNSDNQTVRRENNEVFDTGVTSSFVWDLPQHSKLIASSNFYYGDLNFPDYDYFNGGFLESYSNQIDLYSRQNLLLEMPRAFHEDLAMEASVSWQFSSRTNNSDFFESRHDFHSLGAINRVHWYIADQLILRSGVDYTFVTMDSTDIENISSHDGGIYFTAEYSPAERWLLVPSVKGVATTGGHSAAVIPKMGILWNFTDKITVKNNYYRSFKFPDFEELYWKDDAGMGTVGNPDLRPEDGWGMDIGAAGSLFDTIYAERVFFVQWFKNSIHWLEQDGVWQPRNIGEALMFGFETRGYIDVPVDFGRIKKIVPSGSYQFLLSYLLSEGYTYADKQRVPYTPEHTVNASIDFEWDTGSFIINGSYDGFKYTSIDNTTSLSPRVLLNLSVNQRIGKNFTAFGALKNILNTSYESFNEYPMPGINLTLGLRGTFGQ